MLKSALLNVENGGKLVGKFCTAACRLPAKLLSQAIMMLFLCHQSGKQKNILTKLLAQTETYFKRWLASLPTLHVDVAISVSSGQSYKASTIVIYDSRVVPDLKIPHITTLDS